MRIAAFTGSFDPFTTGHDDIVRRALPLFDRIVIGVGYNEHKQYMEPTEERCQKISSYYKDEPRVEVVAYNDLTVDFCKKKGVSCIIRGLRTTTDFEMESVIAQANRTMAPDIQSIFIPAGHEYSFISSTVVRDVLNNGGSAKCFLPRNVDIDKYLKLRKEED